jgi:hypothetical protein
VAGAVRERAAAPAPAAPLRAFGLLSNPAAGRDATDGGVSQRAETTQVYAPVVGAPIWIHWWQFVSTHILLVGEYENPFGHEPVDGNARQRVPALGVHVPDVGDAL